MGAPKQMILIYCSLSPASFSLPPSIYMSFICMSSFATPIYHLCRLPGCSICNLLCTFTSTHSDASNFVPVPLILFCPVHSNHRPTLKNGFGSFIFQLFIGFGFPYEGPAPLEAIANGCIFLQPKFQPPHSSLNHEFFRGKPTSREVRSLRLLSPRTSYV